MAESLFLCIRLDPGPIQTTAENDTDHLPSAFSVPGAMLNLVHISFYLTFKTTLGGKAHY